MHESTIPIKSNSISVYICRKKEDKLQILLMKRDDAARPDEWGVTYANVKNMEMCWQAALNEVRADTSNVPDRIYSVDMVNQFYDSKSHSIKLVPVFLAFFDYAQDTRPMISGVSSSWVDALEATKMLPVMHQREVLRVIEEEFFLKEPDSSLKVYPSRF